ncbi:hypothetical protein PROFUN_01934 [Planoprotostelium fungivorum]|uniref:TIP41-like protein n=1 Tax=Planoprotostelium fungivorum TaxID=1890364 RepID=A0A2P6NZ37_9EUKA|nr:hypothetical protein PROFUN_01934 [Planoprotostelium fungivorum]
MTTKEDTSAPLTAPLTDRIDSGEHKLFDGPEGKGIEIGGWRFCTTKGHILKADHVDEWQERLHTKNLPEMVFGSNSLSIRHVSGFEMNFNAFDALSLVDPKKVLPKVHASSKWIASKTDNQLDGMEVYQYDWSYTSHYKGSIRSPLEAEKVRIAPSTQDRIDIERLKKPDPILFFDEVHLYEDELDDNGISIMTRVMPTCFLILLRFWLRIDQVLFHLMDTRIYHQFGTSFLVRESQLRESPYQSLAKMMPVDKHKEFTDPNAVSAMLSLRSSLVERIDFNTSS